MFALLFLLFIVTPIAELFVLFRVGRIVGPAPTLAFVIAMGVFGVALAKSQGRRVITQWQDAMARGQVPKEGVLSGLLILLGGLLMIVPGLLTDVLGLLLLIPAVRNPLAVALGQYFQRKLQTGQLRVTRTRQSAPTEVGRAVYRPGDVIDTQGEEIDE